MKKLISFDLQGTLSDTRFSDEFWLDLLPQIYADKHQLSLDEAKDRLETEYQQTGKYHELFYDHRLALNSLLEDWNFLDIIKKLKHKPSIDEQMIALLDDIYKNRLIYPEKTLSESTLSKDSIPNEIISEISSGTEIPIIIISATTRDFIDLELGHHRNRFDSIYSTIDDFKTPGKPPAIFTQVAEIFKVEPHHCFHIGDCIEMDYQNSLAAGWKSFHFDKKQPIENRISQLREKLNNFLENSHP